MAIDGGVGGWVEAAPAVVEGPVVGGLRGHPFGAYLGDIGERGYVEEEFFLSGVAKSFHPPVAGFPLSGEWDVVPDESSWTPYRTRILVRRPVDPAAFNGLVIADWVNVSRGVESAAGATAEVYRGYAHVGVSVQKVGVDSWPDDPRMGLRAWDPQRYGSLLHPGDSYCYDIFTQVLRAIGPGRPRDGVDPMGGLDVTHIIATGNSQSAKRLATHANSISPREPALDGYLLGVWTGSGGRFDDSIMDLRHLNEYTPEQVQEMIGDRTHIRTDSALPVMAYCSETEIEDRFGYNQPNSDMYRRWEIAGTCHSVGPESLALRRKVMERDLGFGPTEVGPVADLANQVPLTPVIDAALWHMRRWVSEGTPPPVQPFVEVDGAGKVVRDQDGNAVGGIRLPDLEVPVGSHHGGGRAPGTYGFAGRTVPFSPEKVRERYKTHENYIALVTAAARTAHEQGVILERHVDEYIARARQYPFPAE